MLLTPDAPFLALMWGALYAFLVARPSGRQLGHTYLKSREKWAYFYFTMMVTFMAVLPGLAFFGAGRAGWAIPALVLVPIIITPVTLLYYRFLLGDHFKDVMEEITSTMDAKQKARKDKDAKDDDAKGGDTERTDVEAEKDTAKGQDT